MEVLLNLATNNPLRWTYLKRVAAFLYETIPGHGTFSPFLQGTDPNRQRRFNETLKIDPCLSL